MGEGFWDSKKGIIITGAIIGFLGVLLGQLESLWQTEFCWACFMEQFANLLGVYKVTSAQYFQLEIIGVILGAFLMALYRHEFSCHTRSSSWSSFVLGFIVMIAILMFLGCPLRMAQRIGQGDLNALWGLAGLICGILIGLFFLKRGFRFQKSNRFPKVKKMLYYWGVTLLFVLFLGRPLVIIYGQKGLASLRSVMWFSLLVGVVIGLLAQRTRFCLMGGFRNLFLCRDVYLFLGFLALVIFSMITNINAGTYQLSFSTHREILYVEGLWNFWAMVLLGWASLFLGGCPLRQLILLGEGKFEALLTFAGMSAGAIFSRYCKLAAHLTIPIPDSKIIVIICLLLLFFIAYFNTKDLKIFKVRR